MAITERRLRTHRPATEGTPTPPTPTRRISNRWALTLGAAWIAFIAAVTVLEPAPATSTIAWWEEVLVLVQLASLGAIATGLARRTSWAGGASLAGGLMFTASTFACPATGHHAFGLWWFGEFAVVLAVTALSGVAYWRHRSTQHL